MADLLQSGLAWLHGQRKTHLASDAVYQPVAPGAESATVAATQSQIRTEEIDVNGFPVSGTVVDFIVTAADMAAEPAPGDKLTIGGRVYEATALTGEPCWRWTDASRLAYRIHTKDLGPPEA